MKPISLAAGTTIALLAIAGAYWGWGALQSRSVEPTQLLDRYMPFPLSDKVVVVNYGSSFIPSIDGGIESTLWRIIPGELDRRKVAEYCEQRPLWTAPSTPGAENDVLLNHSNYRGVRFAPCELAIERPGKDEYATYITYDGKYLVLERGRFWP